MRLILAALLLLQDPSVEDLLEKLRSDRIEERNDAAQELRMRGEAVLPRLEKAAREGDLHLSSTAKQIIRDIRARKEREREFEQNQRTAPPPQEPATP